VFDLGGGTFDVSVLDVGDGVSRRATAGDSHRAVTTSTGAWSTTSLTVPPGPGNRPAQ
jgi:hypothetical protein